MPGSSNFRVQIGKMRIHIGETLRIGMSETRIKNLKDAGVDHIQLSFQDSTREMNDFLSSTKTFDLKNKVAKLIKKYDYPMVLNCVLHRLNIDHIEEILSMAESMGAEYVELANTQFYSWASLNKKQLMPTKKQLDRAEAVTQKFRDRLGNKMKIYFVMPDYYSTRPKKCMNGWGNVFITVQADGTVLPCHVAGMLPNIEFANIKDSTLDWIWYDSPSFNLFRGDSWMKEPCKSCPEKESDLGGCRCQAYMLAGDPASTDPICDKSPHHERMVKQFVKDSEKLSPGEKPIIFRTDKESRRLIHEKTTGSLNIEESRLFEDGVVASSDKSRVGTI